MSDAAVTDAPEEARRAPEAARGAPFSRITRAASSGMVPSRAMASAARASISNQIR